MAYQSNRRNNDSDDHQHHHQPRARFNKNEFLSKQQTTSQESFEVQQPMQTPRVERQHRPDEPRREKKFNADIMPLRDFERMLQECKWVVDVDVDGSFYELTIAQKAQTDLYYTAYRNGAKHMEMWYRHQIQAINEKIRSAARKAAKVERERCEMEFITGDEAFDEFTRQVRHHDWYYHYSDDGDVYRRGHEVHERLLAQVSSMGGIYQTYWNYYQSLLSKKET